MQSGNHQTHSSVREDRALCAFLSRQDCFFMEFSILIGQSRQGCQNRYFLFYCMIRWRDMGYWPNTLSNRDILVSLQICYSKVHEFQDIWGCHLGLWETLIEISEDFLLLFFFLNHNFLQHTTIKSHLITVSLSPGYSFTFYCYNQKKNSKTCKLV